MNEKDIEMLKGDLEKKLEAQYLAGLDYGTKAVAGVILEMTRQKNVNTAQILMNITKFCKKAIENKKNMQQ